MESGLIKCRYCVSSKNYKNALQGKQQLYKCLNYHRCFLSLSDKKGCEVKKLLAIILYERGKSSYRYLAKYYLGRFNRKTKIVSKSEYMVNLSLKF